MVKWLLLIDSHFVTMEFGSERYDLIQYGGGIWVVLCTDFQSGWRDALQGVHSRNVEGTLQLANFWQQLSYYNAVYKAYTLW